MKKKTKTLILSIVVTLVLLLTFTITYAVFTYQGTTTNQQLILGDIYMHYTEKNQINLDNAIPEEGIKVIKGYIPNPIMASQTLPENTDNELSACVDYLTSSGMPLKSGSMKDFCQGTGTAQNGYTFQQNLDNGNWFPEEILQEMEAQNIVIANEIEYSKFGVNPVMANQDASDTTTELYACINYFESLGRTDLGDGETWEAYCRGTNAKFSLQEDVDSFGYSDYFHLLDKNVIIKEINLPYFEFNVSGKNTYKGKDIWYEILLQHGSLPEGKTEDNRIKDNSLKFTLIEIDGENHKVLLDAKKYSDLENKRIWVETINKNTTDEINKTYRLYMWIDENVVIGNVNQDYTMDEWKDVFASIKVGVTGDFNKKELDYESLYDVTDASCFTTKEVISKPVLDTSSEAVSKCVAYFTENGWYGNEGETIEAYCQGTGTFNGMTFQEELDYPMYYDTTLFNEYAENGFLLNPEYTLEITNYNRSDCGYHVVIPEKINGVKVTNIGSSAFRTSFSSWSLKSVVIPDTVTYIDVWAFNNNNYLSHLVLGKNIETIQYESFTDANLSEVIIPDSVKYLDCNAFDSDVTLIKKDELVCHNYAEM